MMKTQFDYTKRVVSLDNLRAMVARISGTCHKFTVGEPSRARIGVTYSNPDEYGTPHPMTAFFPVYHGPDNASLSIVLDILQITHDNWQGEGWQAFDSLMECPPLYRSGQAPNEVWKSEYEFLTERFPQYKVESRWDAAGTRQSFWVNGVEFNFRDGAEHHALESARAARDAENQKV